MPGLSFFWAQLVVFSSLINKPESKKFSIPIITAAVIVAAIFMAGNYVEHNKNIKTIAYLLQVPLFMVIPALLVAIVMIKKKIKGIKIEGCPKS